MAQRRVGLGFAARVSRVLHPASTFGFILFDSLMLLMVRCNGRWWSSVAGQPICGGFGLRLEGWQSPLHAAALVAAAQHVVSW